MPAKHAPKPPKAPPYKRVDARKRGCPITTQIIYDDDELEFLKAVEKYKKAKKRQFPSCSELLGVLKGLGWRKVAGL